MDSPIVARCSNHENDYFLSTVQKITPVHLEAHRMKELLLLKFTIHSTGIWCSALSVPTVTEIVL